jgi:hypothetical protein
VPVQELGQAVREVVLGHGVFVFGCVEAGGGASVFFFLARSGEAGPLFFQLVIFVAAQVQRGAKA